jgi:hypothetical protein
MWTASQGTKVFHFKKVMYNPARFEPITSRSRGRIFHTEPPRGFKLTLTLVFITWSRSWDPPANLYWNWAFQWTFLTLNVQCLTRYKSLTFLKSLRYNPARIRTHDLPVTRQTLYNWTTQQLRFNPNTSSYYMIPVMESSCHFILKWGIPVNFLTLKCGLLHKVRKSSIYHWATKQVGINPNTSSYYMIPVMESSCHFILKWGIPVNFLTLKCGLLHKVRKSSIYHW